MVGNRGSLRWIAVWMAVGAVLAFPGGAVAAPAWTPSFGVVGLDSSAVAMSSDGTTVYAGNVVVDTFLRAAVQVRPPGGPLSPVQLVSAPGVHASLPAVASGPDGRFVVAWSETGVLQTAVMLPGALTFGDIAALPTAGDQAEGQIALAVDQAGAATVVWNTAHSVIGSSTKRIRAGVRPAAGLPSSQVLEEVTYSGGQTGGFYSPRIAVSHAGAAIASWLRLDQIMMTTSTYARAALRQPGQPFGALIPLSSGTNDNNPPDSFADAPVVAMSPTGDRAVAWGYRTYMGAGSFVIRALSGTAAGGLGAVQEPSATGGANPDNPAVAIAADGRVLVGWRGEIAGVYRPQVAFRPPGGGPFSTVQTVATSGDAAYGMELAASSSGQVTLLSSTSSGTGWGLQAAIAPPGGFFGAPAPLATGLTSLLDQNLAATPAGDAVATWSHSNGSVDRTDAAGYDVSGPRLADLTVPSSGIVGDPLAFSVRPVDIWSPVASTTWSFGDGATAPGASVSHAYGTAGARTVGVTATDSLGNVTSSTAPVSVAERAAAGPEPDRSAPVISEFALSRTTFAAIARTRAAAKKVARGTTFRLTLSEPAAATITISREAAGLRRGKRCLPATAALRDSIRRTSGARGLRRARCVRLVVYGALKRSALAGRNSIPFSGRFGVRRLPVAHYRATVVATDAAGNAASRSGPRFRIVRAR